MSNDKTHRLSPLKKSKRPEKQGMPASKASLQLKELAIINQVTQALNASAPFLDIQSACQVILYQADLKKLLNFDAAEICLFDQETKVLKTSFRVPEDVALDRNDRTYQPGEGYTGWIAANQQSLLIDDTHQRADLRPKVRLSHFPYRSYIGTPLKVGTKFLGTLELVAYAPHIFHQEDVTVLEIVANQVAIVIENAHLFSLTNQELQKRIDELSGLQRVSNELNSTLDLDKILSRVLREAMRVTQADSGDVYFYQAATGNLVAYQRQGWSEAGDPQTATPSYAPAISAETGIIGQAFHTGEAILVPDVCQEKDFTALRHRGTRAEVVVPILYGGAAIGVINLESRQPNFFNDNQLRYLASLANHAAVAIGNAQAYQQQKLEREQASRRADQLARLSEISNAFRTNRPLHDVLEDIVFAIAESVGYDVVLISLVSDTPPMIYPKVGAGIPLAQLEGLQKSSQAKPLTDFDAVMQAEFRLGNSYFIPAEYLAIWQDKLNIPYVEKDRLSIRPQTQFGPQAQFDTNILFGISPKRDLWQSGDLLLTPLISAAGEIIGLLTVDNPINDLRPDLALVQTLETFANYATAAIENAQLFELEQQRLRLTDTLRGVAETISSHIEFDELLNIVLQELKKVVDYDKATVELLEEDRLVIIGGRGWEEYSRQMIGLSFSMEGNNPSRKVLETQEPVIVKDASAEYKGVFSAPPYNRIRSWLGVPLTYGTNVLGLMAVSSSQLDFFTLEDTKVVLAFANQVAVALQNARLFDETRQHVRQLAALTEVAQSLNQALDLDEVLNLVLDAVFELVGCDNGSIWLVDKNDDIVKLANTDNIPKFLVQEFNQSETSIHSEPFASVIESGQVLIIEGNSGENKIVNYGLSLPSEVTYVPLKTEDGVIGILAIETLIHSKRMLELVTTLADLAAVAIRNAQLVQRLNLLTEGLEQRVAQRTQELAQTLQDLTEERDRVEILYQITRELSSSFDLDRVLNFALGLLNRAIGISLGSILLVDPETDYLIYRAAIGRDVPLPRDGLRTSYKIGQGLAGRVMEHRESRLIPDLLSDPDWISNGQGDDRRSAIVVPLNTGDDVLGVLMLFHPDPGYFTEAQLKLVSAAGAQIATAVNNAELYRLITDQANRLRVMYQQQAAEAARNEAILKGIADGVLVLDANRNIVLVNPKAAEILNIDAAIVQNQPLPQILELPNSPEALELTRLLYDNISKALLKIETGERSVEFRIDAGQKSIMSALTPVTLNVADSPSIVAVLRDISKEAEIERLKNEFISTVSHELRTPMTSIKGYADLLLSGNEKIGQLNPMQHRFVKVIQSNSNRLTDLVNDILEISRIETGRIKLEFTALDMIQLIREVAQSFEGQMVQKTMHLWLKLPGYLPDVWADKARLTQILVNLIGNAWQYTPEGGSISIYAKVVGEFVQIDIEDTGIGIIEKDIEYVFDRFFRSERTEVQVVDGTGLGLSITKSFVEMLGGQIWLKSELDVGSTFSFTVPLAQNNQRERPIDQVISSTEPQLLIVDDDQEVINLLMPDLGEQGYHVIALSNGDEAFNFARNASNELKFIILATALKDSDSFMLLKQLKEDQATNHIPIWLGSFYVDQSAPGIRFQVADYISTSAEAAQILASVHSVLDNIEKSLPEIKPPENIALDHILIVEKYWTVSKRLKEILVGDGYEVQCAYNSRQALDMATGYKPLLALVNPSLALQGKSIISHFRNSASTKDIPVIVITEQPIFSMSEQNGAVKVLSPQTFAELKQPISVKTLVSKIIQVEKISAQPI
jgi:GAF domain-containing protein/DNA-binding response OmpR family regulator